MPISFSLEKAVKKARRLFGDDAAQEAAVRVLVRQDQLRFESQEKLDAYVMRVAKDFHSRGAQYEKRFVELDPTMAGVLWYWNRSESLPATTQGNPYDLASVAEAVKQVKPELLAAVVDCLAGGWTREQAAERNGVAVWDLRKELKRVRSKGWRNQVAKLSGGAK